jgi:two-component system, OmpR family, response regulator
VQIKTYVVEDIPTIRDNLIAALEELTNVKVIGTAGSEEVGVQWLTNSSQAWDLAIVDLFLERGSGIGILSACKCRLHTQKVIVLSNYVTPDVRKRCLQLGADAVFDKSTELEQMLAYCSKLSQSSDA